MSTDINTSQSQSTGSNTGTDSQSTQECNVADGSSTYNTVNPSQMYLHNPLTSQIQHPLPTLPPLSTENITSTADNVDGDANDNTNESANGEGVRNGTHGTLLPSTTGIG